MATVRLRLDSLFVSVFDRLEFISRFLRALDDSILTLAPTIPSCAGITVASVLQKYLTPPLLHDVLGALDKVLPQSEGKRVSNKFWRK